MSLRLGLIGHPVSHSLSPPMHRAALCFFGLAGSYELLDIGVKELDDVVKAMPAQGFSGFNITIPHKEQVYALCSDRSCEADLVGACNTIRIDSSGRFSAYNTDLGGFIAALDIALPGKKELGKAIILGAGGVARACIAALALLNCEQIFVLARRTEEAERIGQNLKRTMQRYEINSASKIQIQNFAELEKAQNCDLLVNCTPLGMTEMQKADWVDSAFSSCKASALFFDTVYQRDQQKTLMMQEAQRRDISNVDGLDMLIAQAALAFEIWTQKRPAHSLMRAALNLQ